MQKNNLHSAWVCIDYDLICGVRSVEKIVNLLLDLHILSVREFVGITKDKNKFKSITVVYILVPGTNL